MKNLENFLKTKKGKTIAWLTILLVAVLAVVLVVGIKFIRNRNTGELDSQIETGTKLEEPTDVSSEPIEYKKLSEDSYEIDEEAKTITISDDTITRFVLSDSENGPTQDDIWHDVTLGEPTEILDTEVHKKFVYYLARNIEYSLPSAYQEVEYIQSNGSQYIDSGYKPSANTGIEVAYQFTDVAPTQQRVFGVQSSSSETTSMTYELYINGSSGWSYAYKNADGNWVAVGISADTNKHIAKLNVDGTQKWQIDATTGSMTGGPTNTAVRNMGIFATHDAGGWGGRASLKIYTFKIYEKGTLVRNYIPCYRKSDNVIGLYEIRTGTFFVNSGSSSFTKGNNVTKVTAQGLVAQYDGVYNTSSGHSTSTTTWEDISGRGSTALVSNGTWGADYLQFNGTSTWVNLGIMNSDYQTLEVTFSADNTVSSIQRIIGNLESGGGGISISDTAGIYAQYYINGGYKYIESGVEVVPGEIYHVVVTYDGTTIKIYVNGTLKRQLTASGTIETPVNNTVMALGTNPGGNDAVDGFFNGKIYNAAVYNRALSEGEISASNLDIVAQYDGLYNAGLSHNSSTTTWTDRSGRNNNGAISNGTWGEDYLQFNGTSTWVNLGEMNSNYQTLEVTFSIDSSQNWNRLVIGNWESRRRRHIC